MHHHKLNSSSDRVRVENPSPRNEDSVLQEEMDINTDIKGFDVKKTFGISVLLKLTQKSVEGIELSESNGRYRSNLDSAEMNQAVTMTIKTHNIKLKAN